MKQHHHGGGDPSGFMAEIGAKQRNLLWPDTLVNQRGVTELLWRGAPNPTRVQRIAAWLFGLFWVGVGLEFFYLNLSERSLFGIVLSWLSILFGVRIFRNGFPRRK
jgi:hypothetical protein